MTEKTKTEIHRRNFLKTAGLSIGAAAVVGTALSSSKAEAKPASSASERQDAGYQETDHVRTYYKLARF